MIRLKANIRIVLLNTYHPGNIGSTIRAMKTMGLEQLVLVNPRSFPDEQATSLAAGASDLLDKVQVVETFQQAIADCTQVFATSARQTHSFNRPQKSAQQAAQWIAENSGETVAVVFGSERDGMSRDEINQCQQLLFIPGNVDYSVLNIAAAVQIVCYEIFKTFSDKNIDVQDEFLDSEIPNQKELENFYATLQQQLIERGYIRKNQPTNTLEKLRTLLNRANPTQEDISLLRGLFKALTREQIIPE